MRVVVAMSAVVVTSAAAATLWRARAATSPAALTTLLGAAALAEPVMPEDSMVRPMGATVGVTVTVVVPASTGTVTPQGLTGGAVTGAAVSGRGRTTG
jgi:hypothetical protein